MPTQKMRATDSNPEPVKKTTMEQASSSINNTSKATTPSSSMKKKTTIFPKRRVMEMAKKKCPVAYKPPRVETEITTSDEELLEVTKLI